MTSTRALQLAQEVIENDKSKAEALIQLLAAFQSSRGDPLGEAMMSTVLKTLYIETDHCEHALAEFISGIEITASVAA